MKTIIAALLSEFASAIVLTLPRTKTTFASMKGSGQAIYPRRRARKEARCHLLFAASRLLKTILMAALLVASAPASSSLAMAHLDGADAHAVSTTIMSAAAATDDINSAPSPAIDHHLCYCQFVVAFPKRSFSFSAYLEGSRVQYPAFISTLGATSDPDPLGKPPRFSVSA